MIDCSDGIIPAYWEEPDHDTDSDYTPPTETTPVNQDDKKTIDKPDTASSSENAKSSIKSNSSSAPKSVASLLPKAATLSKPKAGKKKLTLKWKAVGGVDGYQIQYGLKKNFKKAKKKTVKGAKKTKVTIKKLKSKKKYFVRIRTYKVVNGKKVYSKWSKVKKVKTK